MSEPRVVLADEPTGNLDSKTGREILALLRDAAAGGRATIVMVVTHGREAAGYGKRTIVIRDGQIASDGSAEGGGASPVAPN